MIGVYDNTNDHIILKKVIQTTFQIYTKGTALIAVPFVK